MSERRLVDVDITGRADGDAVVWDATAGVHGYSAAGGGGVSALNDLSDVDTTGQTSGDVLAFDGSSWSPTGSYVTSATVTTIVSLTQAEYDALTPPDANTLYVITG